MVVVLTLAAVYTQAAQHPAVAGALRGMGAVSAGLIVAMGIKLLPALTRNPMGRMAGWATAAATLLAVGGWRLSMVVVVGVAGPLSVAWAWRQLRHSDTGAGGDAPRKTHPKEDSDRGLS